MDMEEDAMLVAIGFMDIDEAREKWADKWADFCKSLTKWKSVHQLLRLARLNQLVLSSRRFDSAVKDAMKTINFIKEKVYQVIKIGAADVWPWPAKIDSRFAIRKINQVVDAARGMYKMRTLSLEDADYIFGRNGLQGVSNDLNILNAAGKASNKLLKISKAQRLRA